MRWVPSFMVSMEHPLDHPLSPELETEQNGTVLLQELAGCGGTHSLRRWGREKNHVFMVYVTGVIKTQFRSFGRPRTIIKWSDTGHGNKPPVGENLFRPSS